MSEGSTTANEPPQVFFSTLQLNVLISDIGKSTMKNILIFASVFTSAVLISGCTATDWVHAAGGIMGAKDDYDRKARTDRLKKANAAARRVRG
jgi:hypothetical protein